MDQTVNVDALPVGTQVEALVDNPLEITKGNLYHTLPGNPIFSYNYPCPLCGVRSKDRNHVIRITYDNGYTGDDWVCRYKAVSTSRKGKDHA